MRSGAGGRGPGSLGVSGRARETAPGLPCTRLLFAPRINPTLAASMQGPRGPAPHHRASSCASSPQSPFQSGLTRVSVAVALCTAWHCILTSNVDSFTPSGLLFRVPHPPPPEVSPVTYCQCTPLSSLAPSVCVSSRHSSLECSLVSYLFPASESHLLGGRAQLGFVPTGESVSTVPATEDAGSEIGGRVSVDAYSSPSPHYIYGLSLGSPPCRRGL